MPIQPHDPNYPQQPAHEPQPPPTYFYGPQTPPGPPQLPPPQQPKGAHRLRWALVGAAAVVVLAAAGGGAYYGVNGRFGTQPAQATTATVHHRPAPQHLGAAGRRRPRVFGAAGRSIVFVSASGGVLFPPRTAGVHHGKWPRRAAANGGGVRRRAEATIAAILSAATVTLAAGGCSTEVSGAQTFQPPPWAPPITSVLPRSLRSPPPCRTGPSTPGGPNCPAHSRANGPTFPAHTRHGSPPP